MIIGHALLPITEDGRIDITRSDGRAGKIIKLPVNLDAERLWEADKAVAVNIGQIFRNAAEAADWFLRQKK
jgi:hypothetical protein